jgi:hypothetical protein
MFLKKLSGICIVLALLHLPCVAQTPNDYAKNWKTVEDFEKKGLTVSALQEVINIFNLAVKAGNDPQQIKAAMYQMKYRNMVEEDNRKNNIFYIDTLIAKAKIPARNILQSMQAELFWNYLQNHRNDFYNRTQLTEEKSKDIDTWSIGKLQTTIASLYKASLQNAGLLKSTSLKGLDAILAKGQNTRQLRPTLYDLLAHRALVYFMNDENTVIQPAYKFILNDERIFSPARTFINTRFVTRDTASLYYNALLLLQDLLKFHVADANPDALIDADLVRLVFARDHGAVSNKDGLYEEALKHIEQTYNNDAASAQAIFLRAQLYYEKGTAYNPSTGKDVQFELKKAADLAGQLSAKWPKSEGGINAKNLLGQIKKPTLALETEKVNIPEQPFRNLVRYKNVNKLYLRVIKTTREAIKNMQETANDILWKEMAGLNAVKSWSISLPDAGDFQEHAVEIKVDGLPAGAYFILASMQAGFGLNDNILTRQVTYVSNISYISNNKQELYVLDRDNGHPLAGAEVQLWERRYNYSSRKNEEIKKEKYTTDANGYLQIKKRWPNNGYDNFLQIKYNRQELFTDDPYYIYSYNSYERRSFTKSFLFTDRSIYRPGQTVFFKGIVVNTDSASRKSNIMAGYKTTVFLYDANGQKAGAIQVRTNEYGSYNGQFKLPEGSLNGQFRLQDSVNQSAQYFNVEEYKRPKFLVEVKKPDGTYRVNDSIHVTGTAKAYAGNNIDGATVRYRVVRKVRYPVWWGWGYKIWPPYGNNEQMEITNGETTTDINGNFFLTFKAIPDETIDKTSQPVFYYEVSADITDINGETRSGITSVAVAYQALQLNIDVPEKIPADSLKNIRIGSTNLNDLFEKASISFRMYKLQSPGRIFRERYWNAPDRFVMTKEEYYTLFPYDTYADEDQVNKWSIGAMVLDVSDTTSANGKWTIPRDKVFTPGWYKIVVTTKDKYGEEVKAEKFVEITNNNQTADPIQITVDNRTAEPGQKINYVLSTGFDKIWLIHNLTKADRSSRTDHPVISPSSAFSNEIAVTEKDRGGINMSYAFVKHNRMYGGNEHFAIPWSNKDLVVAYETFRDKLLPGSEEKWKIKLSGSKGEKVAAEMLVSMYDASLDQFKPHNWSLLKSLWPVLTESLTWTKNTFTAVTSEEAYHIDIPYTNPLPKSYDALANNGWNEGGYIVYTGYRHSNAVESFTFASDKELQEVSVNQALNGRAAGVTVMNKKTNEAEMDTAIMPVPEQHTGVTTGNDVIQVRKNFNETAFFFPALTTDENGNVEFSFTIPEALTQWKLMTLAHTKDLASSYSEKKVITQKPLMVQPNAPRFVREGDRLTLTTKVVNMSDKEVTGTAQLELFDAATNKAVDGWFKNTIPIQYFTVAAGQSAAVYFAMNIPLGFNSALMYRIKAITKFNADGTTFSDGEESVLPVLTNRMLVTETLPLNMRNTGSKDFRFDKLLNSASSGTLTHQSLTIEFTGNPAWYAVQALPYLMEYPYECAEQSFNRYYANTLAGFIAGSTPGIKATFEKWRTMDSAALLSNLQKNEELKSVLLQETPWVLAAQTEAQQKKNIAILFDMARMAQEKNNTFGKLKEMQSSNGGFVWFKGGPDDRYITQYIITGIGHLRKLNALAGDDYLKLKTLVDKAMLYLDARLKEEYDNLVKYKAILKDDNLSYTAIQYLYMKSFFPEYKIAAASKTAYDYFSKQAMQYWLRQGKYMQGMIALALYRTGDTKTAKAIISSLKENAIYKEEMGMYWKDLTGGGYYWHQAPVESQAMLIEAFSDIDGNTAAVDDMKTWLLKQKQTQNWKTTKATAEACYALLLNGSNWLAAEKDVTINIGNTVIKSTDHTAEAGTGYFKETIPGNKVQQGMGNIHVDISAPLNRPASTSPTWGAVYWQYFEDLDKIGTAETPLKLVKKLFIETNSDHGPVLKAVNDGDALQVGDKIKVRIELRVDRDMEYIHMKDMRAAAMEPVNVISQYKYQDGLGYYESTKDASTHFFFNWLPRGTYVFEYPLFVTHSGNFSNGITTIQCMYAPEFTSHSHGIRIDVAEKK